MMEEIPVFRASKKRKLARQKQPSPDLTEQDAAVSKPPSSDGIAGENDDSIEQANLADLIKARKQKSRLRGVQFSNVKAVANDGSIMRDTDGALIKTAAALPVEDPVKDISNRFTTGMGQVVDVDQHMLEYIDAQMARRTVADSVHSKMTSHIHDTVSEDEYTDMSDYEGQPQHHNVNETDDRLNTKNMKPTIPTHTQYNHLAEVSLANLPSANPKPKTEHRIPRPRKPRLGRDGKPLRPRIRKRANSADQARDRLVEQILSENQPDTRNLSYKGKDQMSSISSQTTNQIQGQGQGQDQSQNQPPTQSATNPTPKAAGTNIEADEKLAAEFKRQFFEGIADRHARHHHTNNKSKSKSGGTGHDKKSGSGAGGGGVGGGSGGGSLIEGPKLGGSRSARAKMYAAILAERNKDKDNDKDVK